MPMLPLYDYYNATFESMIADTDALRRECFRLRYMVYCEENKWETNATNGEQIERDRYDDRAAHALLRHRESGLFIGTVRLILHPDRATRGDFPIHHLCAENGITLPELAH
jgi:N-acyl amino acid synthase of PEP-CTERM/exosortase system